MVTLVICLSTNAAGGPRQVRYGPCRLKFAVEVENRESVGCKTRRLLPFYLI